MAAKPARTSAELKAWLTNTYAQARNLFEMLGVHKGSSVMEIEAARNHLARLLHPDRWEQDDRRKPIAAAAMATVNAACTTLTTKDKRARYLAELATGRVSCPVCGGAGCTKRTQGFKVLGLVACQKCGGCGLVKKG